MATVACESSRVLDRRLSRRRLVAFVLAFAAASPAAHAQTVYWTSGISDGGTFTWSAPDSSNFASTDTGTPGTATYNNGNTAIWGIDTTSAFFLSPITINVAAGGVSPGQMNVQGQRGVPRITFGLSEDNAIGTGDITTNYAGNITFQNNKGSQVSLANSFSTGNDKNLRFTGGDFRLSGTLTSAGGNNGWFIRPDAGVRVTVDNGFAGAGQKFSLTSIGNGGIVRVNGASTAFLSRTFGDGLAITIEVGADNALGPAGLAATAGNAADIRTNATLKAVGGARTISNHFYSRGFNVNTTEDLALNGVLLNTSGERSLQVAKSGSGTLSLGGANTSWWNTVRIEEGVVRITNADGLGNSSVRLSGGVLELAAGNLTLPVGTNTAGSQVIQWFNQGGGFGPNGGFSAFGANRTVNLGGSGATMVWESTAGFATVGSRLIFGSTSSDAQLDFQNPMDLNGRVRTIEVIDNVASTADLAVLSGALSGATGGFEKTGTGTLRLTGTNTYGGVTNVLAGRLLVDGVHLGAGLTTVSSAAILGGDGTLGGALAFNAGAKFLFDASKTLTVNGASVTFGGFSVADVLGLDEFTPEGRYTLIDGTANFGSLANVSNVGPEAAAPIGGGKSAYFELGSLQLVVVPEPSMAALASCGLALAGWSLRRRARKA